MSDMSYVCIYVFVFYFVKVIQQWLGLHFFSLYKCICTGVYLSLTLRRCYSGVVVEQWSSGPG